MFFSLQPNSLESPLCRNFSYALPLKDLESSWEEKLLPLWRFLSLREHVLSFCLALSASLNPPLTRVSGECTALRWPGCSRVHACMFVCVQAHSSDCALYTPNVQRAPCRRETDGGMCITCNSRGQGHVHAHMHGHKATAASYSVKPL